MKFPDVPTWIPPFLWRVLPGGEEWESDSAAGHPVLAARITRLADGPLIGDSWSENVRRHETRVVPLRSGTFFTGRLVIHMMAKNRSPSMSRPEDFVEILIKNESAARRDEDDPQWVLPGEDPVRFTRLVCELNRPLEPGGAQSRCG